MPSPADANTKLRVFISYAREDLGFADQLYAALAATGFDPLLDRHGIGAAEDFQKRLGAMILEADTVVFVLSPASVDPRAYTIWEIGEADRLSKRILPIVIRPLGAIDVPQRLSRLDYIFFYAEPDVPGSGFGSGLARLITALNSDLDWLREHTRLLQLAAEWHGKRHEEHLLRGHLIVDAQQWMLSRPKSAPEVTPLHVEFIRASEEAQALRDSEASQQLERIAAAQSEQARALAAAELAVKDRETAVSEKVAAQARGRFLQRALMISAVGFALVAGGFGLHYRGAQQQEAMLKVEAEQARKEAVEDKQRAELARIEAEAARSEAVGQRRIAEQREQELKTTLDKLKVGDEALRKAQESSSLLLVAQARDVLGGKSGASPSGPAGGVRDTIATLLSALPDEGKNASRPVVAGAEATLVAALQNIPSPLLTVQSDGGSVNSVALIEQLNRAVVIRIGGRVGLIDLATGKTITELNGSEAAVSPDEKFIAVANGMRLVAIAADSGRELFGLDMASSIGALDISPDARKIGVAYTSSAEAHIVDFGKRSVTSVKQPNDYMIHRLIFSPDSRRVLALGYRLYTARLFDVESGRETGWLRDGHLSKAPYGLIRTGAFSPDGRRIATGASDNTVRIWNDEKKQEPALAVGGEPMLVAFSPGRGDTILVGGARQGGLQLWDGFSAKPLVTFKTPSSWLVSAGFTGDGAQIWASWTDGATKIFDAQGKELRTLELNQDGISAAAIAQDGGVLLTGTSQGTVQLWSLERRSELAVYKVKPDAASVAFKSDSELQVAAASGNNQDFDLSALQVIGAGTLAPAETGQPAPQKRSIRTENGDVSIFDEDQGFAVSVLRPSVPCTLQSTALNASATLAAGLCSDNTVRIWRSYPSTAAAVRAARTALAVAP